MSTKSLRVIANTNLKNIPTRHILTGPTGIAGEIETHVQVGPTGVSGTFRTVQGLTGAPTLWPGVKKVIISGYTGTK